MKINMKLGFKLQNLLGTVYKEGNLVFTDGDCLISPVGNKVTVFDLKSNKTQTLQLECRKNIKCLALSPGNGFLMAVDEDDRSIMFSLKTNTSLHYMTFKNIVTDLKFSPNGRYLAVTLGRQVQLWQAPGYRKEFAAWNLLATFSGFYSNTTCLDWSSDSRFIVIGSEDMTSRVFSVYAMRNFRRSVAAGHKNSVVGAFFEKDSLNFYSVSKDGALFHWTCDHVLSSIEQAAKKRKSTEDENQGVMEEEEELGKASMQDTDNNQDSDDVVLAKFTKSSRNFFFQDGADLTSAHYHQTSRVLVAGFSSGVFLLYELPEFIQIHALSISKHTINTVAFNTSGEWLAFGSASLGQLLVWEWQSESYILKQQGHFYDMNTLAYSPDGHLIATGGDDGKVKVWNTGTGFCFVTFHEHTAGVTAVAFNQNGKVVLSASLDGTVRAFDLNRYRNFRTFTSPRLAQFSCLAVDHSGEIISAGARDFFEIYVWSMQTGRLLEVLSGHEGPVSSLAFNPSKSFLVSGSWDKTLKVWDILGRGGAIETMPFGADVIALCFRADGLEVAVATLDGRITFCVPETATELGSIEGRPDLGGGRRSYDKVTAKRLAEGKCFTSLCYSADGQSILAGGKSKFVCIYHVKQQILLKKFQISCNRSLEGIQEHLNSRRMTEAGALEELDTDSDNEDISLPGVAKGDFSSRRVRPEIQTKALTFSPTGRSWAATTTEGLLIYSLDASVVFSPFNLDVDVTPEKINEALKRKEYTVALILSLRLNEESHIDRVLESVPSAEIDGIAHALTSLFAEKLLFHMGRKLEESRHFEFYLRWTRSLLTIYGRHLKDNAVRVMPLLRNLQKTLTKTLDSLGKLCDSNRYMLKYLLEMPKKSAKEDTEPPATEEPQQIADLL